MLEGAATLPFVLVPVLFPVVVLTGFLLGRRVGGRCESVAPTLGSRCCATSGPV
ncbi:hypothetical protein GCM10009721_25000 [Terrabacter tumescens]|uniref:Uncharacterized protein n=1 Tax=Terrabacter tumescens TaxID=60443 RepID=A0ABQ2I1W2_9MICO|nr:hypothetical protein GCM10009721_25000 [Terrabacter tumescens]